LGSLPPGSVVLALPEDGFAIQGIAAVYTTAYPKVNVGNTKLNDRDQRIVDSSNFFRTPHSNHANVKRLLYLHHQHVGYVFSHIGLEDYRLNLFRMLFPGALTVERRSLNEVLYKVHDAVVRRDVSTIRNYMEQHRGATMVDVKLVPREFPATFVIKNVSPWGDY
jgi:hypothetical protein